MRRVLSAIVVAAAVVVPIAVSAATGTAADQGTDPTNPDAPIVAGPGEDHYRSELDLIRPLGLFWPC